MEIFTLANILGLIYMVLSFSSAWAKSRLYSLTFQLGAFIFFALQSWVMGIGGLFILIAFNIVRQIVLIASEKYEWARNKIWAWSFISVSTVVYLLLTPIYNWWVLLPLVARIIGMLGSIKMDNYVAKQYTIVAIAIWLVYYFNEEVWSGFITDVIKVAILAISLPRTKNTVMRLEKKQKTE